ncbi:uncharacterized protein, partial [Littorina saxatilis]|uniref:uncharacterized protein n=1 Tax=Littorina saxatilis TaxID=31220 RepID=UPI0038B4245D
MPKAIEAKDQQIEDLKEQLDGFEQYTRRNSLRIGPVPESIGENTDEIVKQLAKAVGVDLCDGDIDRSHRVGRKPTGGEQYTRSIIVKMATHRKKEQLMRSRKNLKNADVTKLFTNLEWPALKRGDSAGPQRHPNIFVNEDLTKTRAGIAGRARKLKREGRLEDTWTRDGMIFVKKRGSVTKLTTMRELE